MESIDSRYSTVDYATATEAGSRLPGKRFRKGVLLLRDGQQSQARRTSCNNLVNRVSDARQIAPHKVRFRDVAVGLPSLPETNGKFPEDPRQGENGDTAE